MLDIPSREQFVLSELLIIQAMFGHMTDEIEGTDLDTLLVRQVCKRINEQFGVLNMWVKENSQHPYID